MAITLERNEISSPNSEHMCMTLIFGQIKKMYPDSPLGGAIRLGKL